MRRISKFLANDMILFCFSLLLCFFFFFEILMGVCVYVCVCLSIDVRGITNRKTVLEGYENVQAALLDYTLTCYPSVEVSGFYVDAIILRIQWSIQNQS